jgi:uncharacterized lipoprotein YmbA
MKLRRFIIRLAPACAAAVLLAGCLFKPVTANTRRFVLTPKPASTNAAAPNVHLPVGVGLVKLPPYLQQPSIAVRTSANEIDYLETSLWAERLDQAFQRTLAANLSVMIPTDQIRLSSWERGEVAVAVTVNVEQFDVDAQGHGTLTAWWRITAPASNKVLKSGESRLSNQGPSPYAEPQSVAATLSDLTAQLSEALAQAIREVGER